MPADSSYEFDAFVSYSHDDRAFVVETLVPALRNAGLRVVIDDDFQPGAASIVEMERAVERSRHTLVVLSPAYVNSGWAAFEHALAQTLDPAAINRRVVPVLLTRCDPPLRLRALVNVDFTSADRQRQNLTRLVSALRPTGDQSVAEAQSDEGGPSEGCQLPSSSGFPAQAECEDAIEQLLVGDAGDLG
jgi:hypothetical protein